MVKAILIDFWGTIVENGVFPSPIRQSQRIMRLDMPFSEYVVRFEEAFMLQKYENLSDAFNNVSDEFGIALQNWQLDKLIGLWNKNRLLARPYVETKDVLEDLKKEYKLILIADTDCFSVTSVLEKYDMRKLFDDIVLSCDVGMVKTNPRMFEQALERNGLTKEAVVMVGDSIESDVNGALAAGITPILIDRQDKREFEHKIQDLTQLKESIKTMKM